MLAASMLQNQKVSAVKQRTCRAESPRRRLRASMLGLMFSSLLPESELEGL